MIAIITGGTNSEREVSLKSAENIRALLELPKEQVFDFPRDLERFLDVRSEIECAIPMMHGSGGEDGMLQGFLETLNIPYLFSGVEAHAAAMNKATAKSIVAGHEMRIANAQTVTSFDSPTYTHPVVVKPVNGGSSVATRKVLTQSELEEAVQEALRESSRVLIEDCVEGREFTVGVIEKDGEAMALPVVEIRSEGFFDYESKYDATKLAEEICPANIPEDLKQTLQNIALNAHRALGCRQLSRTDIIVDDSGAPYFLETNTIPGMTATSLIPKEVAATGLNLKELFEEWIRDNCQTQGSVMKCN